MRSATQDTDHPVTHREREVLDDPVLLAQIVAVSADAIFSEDLQGRITSWNAAAERLYGCSAADMIGRPAVALVPDATAFELRRAREQALTGLRVERFDSMHQRLDGKQVCVAVTVSPLRGKDGRISGLATSVVDVNERAQLTQELSDVHRRLENQYKAVSRSNRDLEQFAYVASHDLSEPLRVMTGFVQLLEQRYAPLLDERGLRYIAHVVDGAARMRTLIEDLLEYSQFLRAGRPATLVDTRAVAVRAAGAVDGASIEIGPLPDVWCDESSLLAALTNLLSNAAKFHKPDSASRVLVSGHSDGVMVRLCVDDDGIGIEPDYRERVFGMFSRLHVREAYPGTGIGLAIVQKVAEAANGEAWTEASPLGGSRFCLTLPAGSAAAS